jgi:hypothetical protein
LLRSISSRQLSEWMAFYKLEPFGPKREEIHAAMIAMVIANANRDEKSKPSPFMIEDFLLDFEGDDDTDQEALLMKLRGMGFFKEEKTNE